MTRIAIVSPSPLLAAGLAAALSGVPDWAVAVQPGTGDAEALVLHARDAADALSQHAALPPGVPAVLLGDDLRELAQRSASEPRALALLAPSPRRRGCARRWPRCCKGCRCATRRTPTAGAAFTHATHRPSTTNR